MFTTSCTFVVRPQNLKFIHQVPTAVFPRSLSLRIPSLRLGRGLHVYTLLCICALITNDYECWIFLFLMYIFKFVRHSSKLKIDEASMRTRAASRASLSDAQRASVLWTYYNYKTTKTTHICIPSSLL
jgi:hypothetical protein